MNRWELHIVNWKDCQRCPLHKTRQNVVLLRGDVPCDILFIGEAPGHSEDSLGYPFAGEAGNLLQYDIIAKCIPENVSYALSNLLACIPVREDLTKTEEPEEEHVRVCSPRLIDLVDFTKPKLIVCVGAHAKHYLDTNYLRRIRIPDSIPRIHILHPAYITRQVIAAKPSLIKRQVLAIREAIKHYVTKQRVQSEQSEQG